MGVNGDGTRSAEGCTGFREYLMAVMEVLRELNAQAVEAAAKKAAAEQAAAEKELMPRTNRKAKHMPTAMIRSG